MKKSQKRVLAVLSVYAAIILVCGFFQLLEWESVIVGLIILLSGTLSVIYFGKNWKE